MKTLYLTESGANILLDKDTDFVDTLSALNTYDIRNVFYAEEPLHVVYTFGEYKQELDVKKGEFVLAFYKADAYGCPILCTAKSAGWAKQVAAKKKAQQKAEEEWAWSKSNAKKEVVCSECDACPERAD